MKLIKILLVFITMLSLVIISGCGVDEEAPDIYASIYPIEYIVKSIVEDELTVKSVYPRGKDVHDYDPTPKDVIKMSNSKLIFYIGLGLEKIIEESIDSTLKKIPTVMLSTGMELIEVNSDNSHDHDHDDDDHHGVFYDPHIWLDLEKMQQMTDVVLSHILINFELSSDQIEKFRKNAASLKASLKELDNEYFEVINGSNILNKTIMVDHDAYAYWEKRYGINRIRIRNDNESTDAIIKDMIEKIELAKSLKIKYICLTKNELSSSIADQYLNQLELDKNAKVYLHHLATITAEEENNGYDYLSIMRDNLDILAKALPKK